MLLKFLIALTSVAATTSVGGHLSFRRLAVKLDLHAVLAVRVLLLSDVAAVVVVHILAVALTVDGVDAAVVEVSNMDHVRDASRRITSAAHIPAMTFSTWECRGAPLCAFVCPNRKRDNIKSATNLSSFVMSFLLCYVVSFLLCYVVIIHVIPLF